MKYRLLYFASLRDATHCSEEVVSSQSHTPQLVYEELCLRYDFTFSMENLRVAINGEFADWQYQLADNDEIVFLPPVSGG